jgi:aminopeptidase N
LSGILILKYMRHQLRFGILIAGLFVAAGLRAQGHEARLAAIDVLHYRFELEVSDDNDGLNGKALLVLQFKQASDHVDLDLVAKQADGKGMEVTAVQEGKQALTFSQDRERLTLTFPATVAAGATKSIEISYNGIPADGLIISKTASGSRTFFGDNWPNRAHQWLPTVDHPSDKATVEFLITAPSHYQIVANGTLMEQSEIGHGQQLSHWSSKVPLPTKVMVFGAADFAVQQIGQMGCIPVSSWVFSETRSEGFYDYYMGKGIAEWLIAQVGPYPYEKLANVQSLTRYGGMENASCIFYAQNSITGNRDCEALMAHEIAHQWFGNSASEANWHHIWLSEGFATYWTDVYFQKVHGQDTFLHRMADERGMVVNWKPTRIYAVVEPKITDLNQLLNVNSYQKGAWVLHMLRHEVGEDAFFKGIRAYAEKFKYSNALTVDFQREMEKASGKSLGAFFDQWIFRAGHPQIEVTWSWKANKNELTITVKQIQKEDAFQFPLDLGLKLANDATAKETFAITKKEQTFTLNPPAQPTSIRLDPDLWLLFEGTIQMK